jgi:hypothetical protein
MTEDDITQHLIDMLGGGHFVVAGDNSFFFHGTDNKLPFATLVTKDSDADSASNLNRPGVFRLDIRTGEQTFHALFGEQEQAGIDYTALDRLMPHPTETNTHWVSVINPSAKTFEAVEPLLVEARNLLASQGKGT